LRSSDLKVSRGSVAVSALLRVAREDGEATDERDDHEHEAR
jgi:hypothetical protein